MSVDFPSVECKPIGMIHSSLKRYSKVPVQPIFSDVEGVIKIFNEYVDGLKDLDGFEYIICLSYFHLVK